MQKIEMYCGDNLLELEEYFELKVDKTFASGSLYFCKKCNVACRSEETFFPCQDVWIPTRIVCDVCKVRWRLKVAPTAKMENK